MGGYFFFLNFIFLSLGVVGYTPLITWKEFQSCMPWEIAILVGGGFALADGCEVTQFIEILNTQRASVATQTCSDSQLFCSNIGEDKCDKYSRCSESKFREKKVSYVFKTRKTVNDDCCFLFNLNLMGQDL